MKDLVPIKEKKDCGGTEHSTQSLKKQIKTVYTFS